MNPTTRNWITSLGAAAIHGGVSSALTVAGLAGANAFHAGVPPVNLKSFLFALATGGVYSAFLLLKKSPLPGIEVSDTGTITKEDLTSTK